MKNNINSLIVEYNNLDGKTISREKIIDFTTRLFDFIPDSKTILIIWKKLHGLLDKHNSDSFEVSLSKKYPTEKMGLNAPRHSGLAKEALTECGRLKKGYKYDKSGKLVKVEVKKPAPTKKPASLKKPTKSKVVKRKPTKKPTTSIKKNNIPVKNTNQELKNKILSLKDKFGLKCYLPTISQGLNGVYLADGHSIMSQQEIKQFGAENDLFEVEETYGLNGLNAAAKDVEQMVNEMILEKIKTGAKLPPWKQTWATKTEIKAQNFVTKKEYTGSNAMILNILLGSIMPTPYYLTFNQISELKGTLNKGAKSIPLVYYNFIYKLKDLSSNKAAESSLLNKVLGYEIKRKGKPTVKITANNYTKISLTENEIKYLQLEKNEYQTFAFLKYYNVFNIADTTGIEYTLPEPQSFTTKQRIEKAEAIIRSFKDAPKIYLDPKRAYYKPKEDTLHIPSINAFDNAEEYYSTLFHEMIHSTMHESRLNRQEQYKGKKQDAQYAFEELIAELGASYLCGLAGILNSTHLNQATYLSGWHKKLQEHTENYSDFFVFATREAQKAVDYIIQFLEDEAPTKTSNYDAKTKAKAKAQALKLKLKLKTA